VSERGLGRRTRSVLGVASANLRRVPSRTLLGAAGLFVGVAALTVLIALNRAFQGVLVGTLLGNAVSIVVRGVDLLSVGLTIVLGGVSVADVVFLNLRERAPELVTLRSVGWRERDLRALVVFEGIAIGATGSLAGAAVGVALSAFVQGVDAASMAAAASIAAVAGVVVSSLASLGPLAAIGRLTPPSVLAAEG
jgi:ABC-type antimicrobial peptide transport system permease subunit